MTPDRLDNLTLAEAMDLLNERDATISRQATQISMLRQSLREASGAVAPVCAESVLSSGSAPASDSAGLAEALEARTNELMGERSAANEMRAALAEAIAEAERQRAAAAAARLAADDAVQALCAARDAVASGDTSSRETAALVGMELSKAKLQVVTLTEQLADVEAQLGAARVAQHIEARDTMGAASLCRQSVKEIVSLHRALDAIVAAMEDATGLNGAAASAVSVADGEG
jgi:chromosome segregation ATPase